MYIVLATIILFLIHTSVICNKNLRIIGGLDADIEDFPYTVSIRLIKERKTFCAGAIISSQHVISAAHCFDDLHLSKIGIFTGTTSSKDNSVSCYKIFYVDLHPKYSKSQKMAKKAQYDIAIITVKPNITFNQFQRKVELPYDDVEPGEIGIITGWGWTSYPGQISTILQKTTMTITTNEKCAEYVPFQLYSTQICAFQKKNVGACHGDSGAPLVINGKIIGVSSFVRPCATGEPDVFIRVFSQLEFIQKSMCKPLNPICVII